MKVKVNEKCIMCGACSSINKDVFEMTNDSIIVHQNEVDAHQDDCKVAAEACPVDAIEIE